jgi:hypothetical protein
MAVEKVRPEIDYSYQKSVSYSQYSMYNTCQYSWYLAYVKKHKVFKPGIHLLYGTSLHETIQNYLTIMYEQSGVKADEIDLSQYFKDRMIENYKKDLDQYENKHYCTKEEFTEFLADGAASLEWFKKNRSKYFSRKDTELVGIETPILYPITDYSPNVLMMGFIDIIMYNKNTESYTIYDIKTSTRGWGDKEKKDQTKINQILLYKHFYSKALNIPEDKIDVQFFIVKRKIFENSEFPMKRIQEFIPANKSKKVKDAFTSLEKFVKECFTSDAKYNVDRIYEKNISGCKWCPYSDKPELCDKKRNLFGD